MTVDWVVPFFDPHPLHQSLHQPLMAAFQRVLAAGQFILGQEVADFEAACAAHLGTSHAIGVSSGTDALLATLCALDIGDGDEVITSPFTFVATADVILRVGATPVFVDIDPQSFCLDPHQVQRAIGPRTKAVVAVHLFGWPARIVELAQLCQTHQLWLLEDACQAFGAHAGFRAAGCFGIAGCYSFFPTKPLGGLGDGGLVVTDDAGLAERIRQIRSHGRDANGRMTRLGGNHRLDALQAACLSAKLPGLNAAIQERGQLARRYTEALAGHAHIAPPVHPKDCLGSAHAVYTVRVPKGRDALAARLTSAGIQTAVYYRELLADLTPFVGRARALELCEAQRAAREVLSLPLFPGLDKKRQDRVLEILVPWSP